MFERFTENARRTLFYARYEVAETGGVAIETEHILLGLLRGNRGIAHRIFARAHLSYDDIRQEIKARSVVQEKLATSVEIPFSPETKRALQLAAEEADRLLHNYIGTEHLLLGLFREVPSAAASILIGHGLTLNGTREAIVEFLAKGGEPNDAMDRRPTVQLSIGSRDQIDKIKRHLGLIGESANPKVRDLVARIHRDLDELKQYFD